MKVQIYCVKSFISFSPTINAVYVATFDLLLAQPQS